jgi:hypothetical protein
MASSSSSASAGGTTPARQPVTVFGYDLAPYVEKLPPPLRPAATTMLTAQFMWWLGHVITGGLRWASGGRSNAD